MEGKQLYLFGFQKNAKKSQDGFKLVMSLDALILTGVITIIILTLCFSLGIEQGKRIAADTSIREKERLQEATILANLDKSEQELKAQTTSLTKAKEIKITKADKKAREVMATQTKENTPEVKKRYHIQVASFKAKSTAKKAADKLKQQGHPILIAKKGDYFVVYVGGFETELQAKKKLEVLKKTYKDCLLRRL